jgi:hypothetical protein
LDDLAEPVSPRLSWASALALLGAIGLAVGSFLPWFDVPSGEREDFVLNRSQLERWEKEAVLASRDASPIVRGREWLGGGSLNAWGWLALSRRAIEHAGERGIEAREVRAWNVAIGGAHALPFAAGLLALVLAFGRLRPMGTGAVATCLLLALAVAAIGALLVLGASENARASMAQSPRTLGLGGLAFAASGAALGLAGLSGGTWSRRWRGWLLALGLAISAVLGTGIYVAG